MDLFKSFHRFVEKFGPGKRYADISAADIAELKAASLPDYYLAHLEAQGLEEYSDGFWWFLNPLEEGESISFLSKRGPCFPVIRNAFGGCLVLCEGFYWYASPQTTTFSQLGKELGLIFNMTLTDDYAVRDMFFGDFYQYAVSKLGKIGHDEMYAFVPAPALGGEFRNGNIQIVKRREHLHFLAQLA